MARDCEGHDDSRKHGTGGASAIAGMVRFRAQRHPPRRTYKDLLSERATLTERDVLARERESERERERERERRREREREAKITQQKRRILRQSKGQGLEASPGLKKALKCSKDSLLTQPPAPACGRFKVLGPKTQLWQFSLAPVGFISSVLPSEAWHSWGITACPQGVGMRGTCPRGLPLSETSPSAGRSWGP